MLLSFIYFYSGPKKYQSVSTGIYSIVIQKHHLPRADLCVASPKIDGAFIVLIKLF